MKNGAWTRRPPHSAAAPQGEARLEHWDIDEEPTDVAGWSTGVQANTATVFRWAAWGCSSSARCWEPPRTCRCLCKPALRSRSAPR